MLKHPRCIAQHRHDPPETRPLRSKIASSGGTGANTAATARTALGAAASGLATASGLTISAVDKILGLDVAGPAAVKEIACTSVGRSVIASATLAALKTLLGIGTDSVVTKTASYPATTTDDVILCNTPVFGPAITIQLPDITTCAGKRITVKKIDGGIIAVNIVGSLAQPIDGSVGGQSIAAQWTALEMVADLASLSWFII